VGGEIIVPGDQVLKARETAMVSATDYPQRSRLLDTHELDGKPPRKPRFRLFAALAAPFRDVDDRALYKKRKQGEVRNNSKGNLFVPGAAAAPARIPVRRFQRGGD
jgi:hypothetical protein